MDPFVGRDRLSLSSTPLYFSHPKINRGKPLIVRNGANQITWPYVLNTNTQNTYGGQVIQILSCTVEQCTVNGNTVNRSELREIYGWFLDYMRIAGLGNRVEEAVTMQYPERGWQFLIQPVSVPNFIIHRDQVVGEWNLTAEMVADTDTNYLSQKTMNDFTKGAFNSSMINIGFDPENPAINPLAAINQDDLDQLSHNIGNNFQSLIGAYASGDFMHWAFDSTQSTGANKLKASQEYWTEIFGNDFVRKGTTGTASGSAQYLGPANPTTRAGVAGLINDAFQAHGVPGYIGVATALHESAGSLDANIMQFGSVVYGSTGVGLFQATPPNAPSTPNNNANVSAGKAIHAAIQAGYTTSSPGHSWPHTTDYYSAVSQANDAAYWFNAAIQSAGIDPSNSSAGHIAFIAQRPADQASYEAAVNGYVTEARNLIQQSKSASGLGPKALAYAKTQIGTGETPPGSNITKYGAWYGLNGQPWCAIFVSYCFHQVGSSFKYSFVPTIAADAKSHTNGLTIVKSPSPGTLALMGTTNTDGEYHVGFFDQWVSPGQSFYLVSGNDNNQVSRDIWHVSQVAMFVQVSQ